VGNRSVAVSWLAYASAFLRYEGSTISPISTPSPPHKRSRTVEELEETVAALKKQQEEILQQLNQVNQRGRGQNQRGRGQNTNQARGFSGRGKKKRTRYRRRTASPDEEEDTYQNAEPEDDRDPNDYQCMLKTSTADLDPNVRKAKNALMVSKIHVDTCALLTDHQKLVNEKFREVCGVTTKMEWPTDPNQVRLKEGTAEQYLTPNFKEDVTHQHNRSIFRRVQHLIVSDFEVSNMFIPRNKSLTRCKQDPLNIPIALKHKSVYYNKDTIYELTKNAFRSFKPKARAQDNPRVKDRLEINAQLSRRRDRRLHVRTQLHFILAVINIKVLRSVLAN
jgi:hypothetical protein